MKSKGRNQIYKLSGKLKSYIMWPLYVGIILLIVTVVMYVKDTSCGNIMLGFVMLYAVVYGIMIFYLRPGIMHEMIEFSSNYSQVQHQLLYELSVPYCLLDNNGRVLWMNRIMMEKTDKKKDFRKNIQSIFPQIKPEVFPTGEDAKEMRLAYNGRDYLVEMKRIAVDALTQQVDIIETEQNNSFIAMYMFDETDINMYIQKIKDERFVVGLIYIDNYEEALESIDDVRRSLFIGLIDKRVNKYFACGSAIVRKMEKDKYLAIFRYKYLEKLMSDRFSLLEDIKSVKIGNEMTLTLSIGVGTGASDYAKNYDVAKSAMDLALGRGGDQAVVKDGEKTLYYGGKSQQMEKNTRVKARVKALALKEIITTKDKVLVMGHANTDVDSFGAAVGIYRIAKTLGRNAHIVLNTTNNTIKPWVDSFKSRLDHEEEAIITNTQAIEMADNNTVLVIVDVNKPSITECPDLLKYCRSVVVLDHHRQGEEVVENATLSYVEPYASSACEMVAEILQYVGDGIKVKGVEADCLYAGIVIDTNNFVAKAGVRTFEAAAFLRRSGADVTRVRKMFREDANDYRAKADAVGQAKIYMDEYAISVCHGEDTSAPTVVCAQAANELLNIKGIKASFVLTQYNQMIYISARSIDEVNVQVIMEKLGGGGHMNVAGAQLKDISMEMACERIRDTLKEMKESGEI